PTSDPSDRSRAVHLPTPSAVHRAAMSAAHASTAARVQGPVQYATTGSLYKRSRSLTSSGPTGVRTSRSVSTGAVGPSAGRFACIYTVNSVATPQRRLEWSDAVRGGAIEVRGSRALARALPT